MIMKREGTFSLDFLLSTLFLFDASSLVAEIIIELDLCNLFSLLPV